MKINPNLIFINSTEPMPDEDRIILSLPHREVESLSQNEIELSKNGFLSTFRVGRKTYLYNPSKAIFQTFMVKFTTIKVIKDVKTNNPILLKGEEDRAGSLRRFIAHWICGQSEIKNNRVVQKYVYLYTYKMPLIISVPDFLIPDFVTIVTEAGCEMRLLSPEVRECHCNYCGFAFSDSTFRSEISCPKCGNTSTV